MHTKSRETMNELRTYIAERLRSLRRLGAPRGMDRSAYHTRIRAIAYRNGLRFYGR